MIWITPIAGKMKFSIKDFFSKCGQIHRKLRIGSHLRKKFLMENFISWEASTLQIEYANSLECRHLRDFFSSALCEV